MKNIFLILLLMFCATLVYPQSLALKRASQIGKGMNLSWLDQRWKGTAEMGHRDYVNMNDLPRYKKQIKLIHDMGYQFLRFPVCFDLWYQQNAPYKLTSPQYYAAIDSIVKWTGEYHMMLSIDYHHGKLSSENMEADLERINFIWKEVAARYKNTDPERVFFEIFNEPSDVSETEWQTVAQSIIATIRVIDTHHTLIVGAAKWNGLDALLDMPLLADTNLLYTFHFYDPFLYTHQGASWTGNPTATRGVPYPYRAADMPPISESTLGTWGEKIYERYPAEGNYQALFNRISQIKKWSVKNKVPVLCGEWGAYKEYTTETDRCQYFKDIYTILDTLQIPNSMWEWDGGFSFFSEAIPSVGSISPCIKEAMRLKE